MYKKTPKMAVINAKRKPFTGVSFFSGCGGSSTGHKMAGVNILYANEFIKPARASYEANHVGTIVDGSDIRKVDPKKILKQLGLKRGELDLLDMSPPCKSFSVAGARESGWNKEKLYSDNVKQRTDDLFDEGIRMVAGFYPKIFVAENVPGLVKGNAKGYFVEILKNLENLGYEVKVRVLNAAYLGVPQARERLIFVGVRKDLVKLGFHPLHPEPLSYNVTVKDVLPHIVAVKTKKTGLILYVPSDVPSPTITASDGTTSETASFSCGGFVEDDTGTRRKYTISELKKISSFPKDFKLTGTFEQRFERIGRAVPPMMMYHVTRRLVREILIPYYKKMKLKPKG